MTSTTIINNLKVLEDTEVEEGSGRPYISVSFFGYTLSHTENPGDYIDRENFREVVAKMLNNLPKAREERPFFFVTVIHSDNKRPQFKKMNRIFQWAQLEQKQMAKLKSLFAPLEAVELVEGEKLVDVREQGVRLLREEWEALDARCSFDQFCGILGGKFNSCFKNYNGHWSASIQSFYAIIYLAASFPLGIPSYSNLHRFIPAHFKTIDPLSRDLLFLALTIRNLNQILPKLPKEPSLEGFKKSFSHPKHFGLYATILYFYQEYERLIILGDPLRDLQKFGLDRGPFYADFDKQTSGRQRRDDGLDCGFSAKKMLLLNTHQSKNQSIFWTESAYVESQETLTCFSFLSGEQCRVIRESMSTLKKEYYDVLPPQFIEKGPDLLELARETKILNQCSCPTFHRYDALFFYFLSQEKGDNEKYAKMGEFLVDVIENQRGISLEVLKRLVLSGRIQDEQGEETKVCSPIDELDNGFLLGDVFYQYTLLQAYHIIRELFSNPL